jgi:hypothetical protein
MRILSIMIAAQQSRAKEGYEALQNVALHVLKIRHGTGMLPLATLTLYRDFVQSSQDRQQFYVELAQQLIRFN